MYTIREVEEKNVDGYTTSLFPIGSAAGLVTHLNPIQQGTGPSQRIGRKVTMSKLIINFWMSFNNLGNGSSPVRLLVVYDRQSSGITATAAEIMALDDMTSFPNLGNSERFQIIMDKWVDYATAGPASGHFTFACNLNLPCMYGTSTLGTVANMTTGAMYLLSYSNGAFTTQQPFHVLASRVMYIDQ